MASVVSAQKRFGNPRKVKCVSPDKDEIYVEVSEVYMRKHGADGRTLKLMEYWPLILGEKPPVNNIGKHESFEEVELKGLSDAHALYKGIKRGCNNDEAGSDIYIYLTKPRYSYKLVPDMVCMAKRFDVPENWLLAVYVMFDKETGEQVRGTIVDWHFVTAQEYDSMKPIDDEIRYEKKVW